VNAHHAASSSAASAKRVATDHSGATTPSWNLIASHVEPQIAVEMAKSADGERSDTIAILACRFVALASLRAFANRSHG